MAFLFSIKRRGNERKQTNNKNKWACPKRPCCLDQLKPVWSLASCFPLSLVSAVLLLCSCKCVLWYSLLLRNLSSCSTAIALVQRMAVWISEYRVNAMLAVSSSSSSSSMLPALRQLQGRGTYRK